MSSRHGKKTKKSSLALDDKSLASQLKNLIPSSASANNGPRDKDRRFCKWTDEQVAAFLLDGQVDAQFIEEEDEEKGADVHQICAIRPMPLPRPIDSVYGGQIESEALLTDDASIAETSKVSTTLNQTGILASLLDPDAGGKGQNSNGLVGFISAKPKPKIHLPADARHPNESRERQELRAKLHARLRASRNQRGTMQESQIVYDEKGRRVRNARQPNPEDAPYVRRTGAASSGSVDRDATIKQRQQILEKMRQKIAARGEAAAGAENASVAVDEESSESESE